MLQNSWTTEGPEHRGAPKTYGPLVLLSAVALGGAGLLQLSGSAAFAPYFGSFNSVAATGVTVLIGGAALVYLRARRWFDVGGARHSFRSILIGIAAAVGFALPVVAIDVFGAFPQDLNVEPPQSIVFYPVIAVVAEYAFHVVPLALLLMLGAPLVVRLGQARIRWSCVVLVSLIEPTLQTLWASPASPAWVTAYVAVHVFAINLTILYLFGRFDFVTAYGFRVLYYLMWHGVWGAARLPLLFER